MTFERLIELFLNPFLNDHKRAGLKFVWMDSFDCQ